MTDIQFYSTILFLVACGFFWFGFAFASMLKEDKDDCEICEACRRYEPENASDRAHPWS